ncbi:hypothetical protein QE152_g35264 [Popillia japonica]|uniref:Polyprotein n=1 Tax=Popillia japonica TaxID=7064 RepID=A0AAW1IGJ9_POPJA
MKRDVKARNIIVQWLADNVLETIKDKKTTKDIFDTLRQTYTKAGNSVQVEVQSKLRNIKYRNGSLADFITDYERIIQELKGCGGKIKDNEMISQLVTAMPESFQAVTTAIDVIFKVYHIVNLQQSFYFCKKQGRVTTEKR